MRPFDHAELVKAVTSSLRREAVQEDLTGLLRRIRSQAGGRSLELGRDAELRRFLFRLGLLGSMAENAKNTGVIDNLVERAARDSGEDPATVSVKLRLFASGAYGVVPEAVCGDSPRCGFCPLTGSCRYATEGEEALPEGESPAERLKREGAEVLSTGELLSVVLRTRGKDAEALKAARKLLNEAGSLRKLARRSVRELSAAGAKGSDAPLRLAAALALAQRTAGESREPGVAFRCGDDVYRHFRHRLRDVKQERFFALLLDSQNRMLSEELVSQGSLSASPVGARNMKTVSRATDTSTGTTKGRAARRERKVRRNRGSARAQTPRTTTWAVASGRTWNVSAHTRPAARAARPVLLRTDASVAR